IPETCYKEVCCTVCRPVCETCMKEVCCTTYNTVQETCYRECKKTVCKPVCEMKTVQKKCGEWVCETYCVPGRKTHAWVRTGDQCCFDPCGCKMNVTRGHWQRCEEECPGKTCTRKVWKERTVCEQVPCTTYKKECVVEKVPYTVCKKI